MNNGSSDTKPVHFLWALQVSDTIIYPDFFHNFNFGGISAAVGFGRTLATAKKTDPNFFNKGMVGSIEMAETGSNLAMRALGWGTFFAIVGTGSLTFAIWKLSGATDVSFTFLWTLRKISHILAF